MKTPARTTTSASERLAARRGAKRSGRAPRGADAAITVRREQVLNLRRTGATFQTIAEALKISKGQACKDFTAVMAELDALTVEHAEHHRRLELDRLDEMQLGLRKKIAAGVPSAIVAATGVSRRRAALLGLDEPIGVDARLTVPQEFTLRIEPPSGKTLGGKTLGTGKP